MFVRRGVTTSNHATRVPGTWSANQSVAARKGGASSVPQATSRGATIAVTSGVVSATARASQARAYPSGSVSISSPRTMATRPGLLSRNARVNHSVSMGSTTDCRPAVRTRAARSRHINRIGSG